MIKFINDKLLIVDSCGTECYTNGYEQVENIKGELFDREEVKHMIDDLLQLLKLQKDMRIRGHTKCMVITKPIYFMKDMEDCALAESNNMPVREISLHTLSTFIESIPLIARWL